ncbi:amidohydrolase [Jiangella muralis]|uniref:amidohydrolase n=1 Tax=Jiangella muralis TaxID=702383 RepID=UPI000A41D618|nr:amidohydrolase family protein [Jiangella muralis]
MTTTLYRNGRIHSPADPFATAMLVVDETVAWVGADGAARTHLDAADEVVDLGDALVAPAFVDAHVHLTETGLARDGLDLTAATGRTALLDLVARRSKERPGEVVLGFGWEEDGWPDGGAPTPGELDQASNGTPVYLARRDVHTAAVSGTLLAADRSIARADGYDAGLVRRDAHHRARQAARSAVPAGRMAELREQALRHAASLGIGAVHEIGSPLISDPADFTAVLALGATPGLPDVIGYWGATAVGEAQALGAAGAAGDLNLDGSIGSRSARLSAPYADAPGERGRAYLDLETATEHVVASTRAGIQAGFHCIGDEAVRTAVQAIAAAAEVCGLAAVVGSRHRLEHVEMIDDLLIAELARLGVAASVQPAFDALWGGPDGMYVERLGPARGVALNPFAAMARAGVLLAFGSDSPVTPLAGWETVRAASQHRTPSQRISARAAFSAATRGGWRAARVEDAGVLAPGMRASFAVWEVPYELVVQAPDERVAAWSTDPRAGVPGLPDLSPDVPLPRCLRTVVRGRTAYADPGT